jgi:hypothetical protein
MASPAEARKLWRAPPLYVLLVCLLILATGSVSDWSHARLTTTAALHPPDQ